MKHVLAIAALVLAACTSASLAEPQAPDAPTWRPVDPDNLVILQLATGTVAVELFPDAAPAHVAQLRKMLREGFFDGEAFYRVIEGHIAQAGREFPMASKPWPDLPLEAERAVGAAGFTPHGNADLFAPQVGHRSGFAVGRSGGKLT